MAYTPINWQTGQTITAEKLNKMDNGWSISSTVLTSETVTTEMEMVDAYGELSYSTPITASTIVVTFNGTQYTLSATVDGSDYIYGDFDFVSVPFYIGSNAEEGNGLGTPEAGTYSIEISTSEIDVGSQFASAVKAAFPDLIPPFKLVADETTIEQYRQAVSEGRYCYIYLGAKQYGANGTGIPSSGKTPLTVYPTPEQGSFAFDSENILRHYND